MFLMRVFFIFHVHEMREKPRFLDFVISVMEACVRRLYVCTYLFYSGFCGVAFSLGVGLWFIQSLNQDKPFASCFFSVLSHESVRIVCKVFGQLLNPSKLKKYNRSQVIHLKVNYRQFPWAMAKLYKMPFGFHKLQRTPCQSLVVESVNWDYQKTIFAQTSKDAFQS